MELNRDTEFTIGALGAFFLGAVYLGGIIAAGLMYGNRWAVAIALASAGCGYLCQVLSLLLKDDDRGLMIAASFWVASVITGIVAGLGIIFGG